MKDSYIVLLYIRRLFKWKMHGFYSCRAYAFEAARALEDAGIKIKLVQVSSNGEKDRIYESRFK